MENRLNLVEVARPSTKGAAPGPRWSLGWWVALAFLLVPVGNIPAASAQTICRAVRIPTNEGWNKGNPPENPWVSTTVAGTEAVWGHRNGTYGETSALIGLHAFDLPYGAIIQSIRVYGHDSSARAMTFRLLGALVSIEAENTYATWSSTNAASSWISPTIGEFYNNSIGTYWIAITIPTLAGSDPSSAVMNVHTARLCHTL
jgi:hypothetical protein